MKFIQNILDKTRPAVTTGKLKPLYPLHNALETMMFVPDHTAHSGAHVRDSIDLKRTMVTVIFALVPAMIFGMWNTGYWHFTALGVESTLMENFLYGVQILLPMIIVTYAAGLGVEILFSYLRKHPVNEGFLVSGMLIPLIMPADIPLWMVAISTIFAVLIGKEVFGGTGMNILNPALTARAFAFFAYPSWMSGDQVWISGLKSGEGVVDGFSGATALGQYAAGSEAPAIGGQALDAYHAFIGQIPGSIGETSTLAILIGAIMLIASGIGSWKIMLSGVAGALTMGLIFNLVADYAISTDQQVYMALPFWQHLVYGGFAFGIVLMATDPVSAAQTEKGKWIYGFLTGIFCIMIRVFNPAFPEGVMLAILFMNVMAPLIDHYVIQANVKKRQKRAQLATANS
ncbi:NADH:ubiquinone reductase (Na(+)-transporting) subunit B [Phaeocystidibacter marisrubri]|uniref:Na(+)-translocating NADH-quinone reductase subunit B n=1 Tax=Phaeocystidibacter marisrubri TaxID=1577780 RepID=A0A6L3ZJ96_9FLAO|nr:NADH:ubiquinone reductase (Na(+)-transporting) subunit B [Phaeocystidibacter marisrubri]KAB2817240.1 NADH:ubiquinone reductase (Na(+)-transporting) subunit B [Phaeocystidibacter marisrubri]GGH76290.1 Na(+)-translocating NADH-quinone reductase subunit B [Phaeocystidibacter marisrubri]